MTKTIEPHTVGDTRDNPRRTILCLKAWMLWRANMVPGWIQTSLARERLFAEEAEELLTELRRWQPQPDGVLGHPQATRRIKEWVPDLVARL